MPHHLRCLSAIFTLLFVSAMASTALGQQVGFYFEKSRKRASIPFELHNNLIIISASLNDEYPLKFILDTGVRPTILLDKNFTDSIGMNYQREVELFGVGNSASVKALVIGGVSLSMKEIGSKNLSVLVLEKNFMELERHLGAKIHGIIGYDFFGRFVVKINYQKKRIDLFEPHDFQPPRNYNVLDLGFKDSKPYVNLKIHQDTTNVIQTNLLIDTGASHPLILNPLSEKRIRVPGKFIYSNLGRGLSGELSGKLGRVDQMVLGEYVLEDVIASYIEDQEEEPDNNQRPIKNGSIGGELLGRFTIIFDYYHKALYLKPNRSFRQPFEYNMSGLEFIASGENLNQFIINSIRSGTAADAIGFQAGDMLISLNEIPAKKLSLSRIYSELSLKEGKEVNLTVIRHGVYISKSFYLHREI